MWRRIATATGSAVWRAKAENTSGDLFKWIAYFDWLDDRETKLERQVARLCHLVDCVIVGFGGGRARSEDEFLVKYDRTPKAKPKTVVEDKDAAVRRSKKAWMVAVGMGGRAKREPRNRR